jgi:hypothetical protein
MPSEIVPSPRSSVPVWLFPGTSSCGCFRQTGRWCWCQSLGSHILAFHNSVSLPSRRHESIYREVNKLQDIKPSICVWQHTPATPRGRPSSSQPFRSITFAYLEGICWQPTRHFAAKKRVVQITNFFVHSCKRRKFDLGYRIFSFWWHVDQHPRQWSQ